MSPQQAAKLANLKLVDQSEGLVPSPKNLAELHPLTMPRGGIDRLNFTTWDTIEVPGVGEDTFQLQGYYVIERENPSSASWPDASVNIFMRELAVSGISEKFGRVDVAVNPDMSSGGQVRPGTRYPGLDDSPKLCVMEGFMMFSLPDAGITAFNKDVIRLTHFITHIPPVGQGGGTGNVEIKLYRVDDPDGPPVAILKEVRTNIGTWLA
jgi:hypothetical protein